MKIRVYQDTDWNRIWAIIKPVFRAGETYAFPPDITEPQAYRAWIDMPQKTYVAISDNSEIIGTFFIKPNHPGPGSHVCNCGYIVAKKARGKGVAAKMCAYSQQVAMDLGYLAMQYNLVVSTNKEAVHLWKKHGFKVIGTLPGAFFSKCNGYVDALVMFKQLR
jgi:RimJ/RimL family protein N-acetyltransferase